MKTIHEIRNNIYSLLCSLYDPEDSNSIAFILMESVLNQGRTSLIINKDTEVNKEKIDKIERATERLLKSEPIQYVVGEAYFLGRKFIIEPSALIPRQETEELVLKVIKNCSGGERILDIGCGSGVISISLALEVPGSKVTGIDVSENALELSKRNATLHSTAVQFLNLNILKDGQDFGPFDFIVSNPPYVLDSEKSLIRDNVLKYEPESALFVRDNDPLVFYNRMVELKRHILSKNGRIFVEINERFGKEIQHLFTEAGAISVEIIKDINGKDRIVIASFGNS